jgi:8-oxo-dGTP pyrophosphatase MutT (NUDIX family)
MPAAHGTASVSSAIEALPGSATETSGKAVDLDQLWQVLSVEPASSPCVLEDGVGEEDLLPAAVLFPIVRRNGEPTVLLTQRTAHLRDHPGQISFPGGRCEASDPSPADTALRETIEEIGLSPAHVEIIGYLPEYRTSTGFRVTPVVAMVTPPFDLQLDTFEVAEAFEVPLSFLMDPANHQRHSLHYRGKLRHYYAMPFGDYFIWGATAGIIMSLYRALEVAGR